MKEDNKRTDLPSHAPGYDEYKDVENISKDKRFVKLMAGKLLIETLEEEIRKLWLRIKDKDKEDE